MQILGKYMFFSYLVNIYYLNVILIDPELNKLIGSKIKWTKKIDEKCLIFAISNITLLLRFS